MTRKILKLFLYAVVSTVLIVISLIFLLKSNVLSFQFIDFWVIIVVVFLMTIVSVWMCFVLLPDSIKPVLKQDQELATLKSIEKYRREFFGNVSHELKTPIFNIQGYVETLIDGALYDKTVNKKYLKRTRKSVDRLIYIIKDLESIAQLESQELSLEMSEWKLKNLINEILDQFEIKAKKKKIELIHDKKSTNFFVKADKGKIGQVLSNLISNSIKYGKHGGVTKISCHQSKTECLISVKDNGIGVAEKNISRLFERFYRVDKSRSRDQGGTGLGLAIVKHIIEAHGEKINVTSSIKKGTDFTFSIACFKCDK